ncbi:MAG: hypothetical protein EU544_00845, partial [Promethearchaeota archaeon]
MKVDKNENKFSFKCPDCKSELGLNLNDLFHNQNVEYNKKAFIISPIGDADSPIRKEADEVLNYVIKPALDDFKIQAIRADQIKMPGKITDQMFDAIFGHDLCVAVVTEQPNPNVFYEIAIAQCAKKPLIILIPKGSKPPFDIHTIRCIEYDLSIEAFLNRTYINDIKEQIKEFERLNYKSEHVIKKFEDYILDLYSIKHRRFEIFPHADRYSSMQR